MRRETVLRSRLPCRTGGMRGAAALLALALAGCAGSYVYSTSQHDQMQLSAELLREGGVVLITPSTVTGQEEDKQALALSFAEVLTEQRPDIRLIPLSQTVSAVNRAGLAGIYESLLGETRGTGVLNRDALRQIGELTGARYTAQLKMAGFWQSSLARWSLLGLRLMDTKRARIRLFLQLWDNHDGSVVWEAAEELAYAQDTYSELVPSLRAVAREASKNLIARLPGAPSPVARTPAGPPAEERR